MNFLYEKIKKNLLQQQNQNIKANEFQKMHDLQTEERW